MNSKRTSAPQRKQWCRQQLIRYEHHQKLKPIILKNASVVRTLSKKPIKPKPKAAAVGVEFSPIPGLNVEQYKRLLQQLSSETKHEASWNHTGSNPFDNTYDNETAAILDTADHAPVVDQPVPNSTSSVSASPQHSPDRTSSTDGSTLSQTSQSDIDPARHPTQNTRPERTRTKPARLQEFEVELPPSIDHSHSHVNTASSTINELESMLEREVKKREEIEANFDSEIKGVESTSC
ncbi:unnamed protein product [Lactuca saligna]|uniref:Uncharacterized protein n=1 Tax=Lactuca saligna TaxID=75948 RepID=A0AA35UYI6_LACSI|nr:unnamed protein product [Lactuca saligna]